eukprot:637800-Rhodomonas_salina.1
MSPCMIMKCPLVSAKSRNFLVSIIRSSPVVVLSPAVGKYALTVMNACSASGGWTLNTRNLPATPG